MATNVLEACEALVSLLAGLSEWPDEIELEDPARRKVAKNEVDVAVWRENRSTQNQALGETGPSSALFSHETLVRVSIHITGDKASARAKLDAMLLEAGVALGSDPTLGGLISGMVSPETTWDWDEGSSSGQAFHEVSFALVLEYDSNNPLI